MQRNALLSSLSSAAVAVVMRVAMTVMVVMATMVSVAATLARTLSAVTVVCCYAPEAMAAPGAFLALFGAVLCAAASAAFRELPWNLFPLAALPVCTLSDTTTGVIFPAEITHHYTSPV